MTFSALIFAFLLLGPCFAGADDARQSFAAARRPLLPQSRRSSPAPRPSPPAAPDATTAVPNPAPPTAPDATATVPNSRHRRRTLDPTSPPMTMVPMGETGSGKNRAARELNCVRCGRCAPCSTPSPRIQNRRPDRSMFVSGKSASLVNAGSSMTCTSVYLPSTSLRKKRTQRLSRSTIHTSGTSWAA